MEIPEYRAAMCTGHYDDAQNAGDNCIASNEVKTRCLLILTKTEDPPIYCPWSGKGVKWEIKEIT